MPIPMQPNKIPRVSSKDIRQDSNDYDNDSLPDFEEMGLEIKKAATKPPVKSKRASKDSVSEEKKPTRKNKGKFVPSQLTADDDYVYDPEFKVDRKTGVSYEKLPPTVIGPDGNPVLQVDINDMNLSDEASRFLGHLRVPPNKEEQAELRKERARLMKKQQEEFAAEEELD